MVRHSETNKGPGGQDQQLVPQSAATTPAIVGICLGATLFLVGIISVTLLFVRRKSVGRKSGVCLSEQMPLQSQYIIHRRSYHSPESMNNFAAAAPLIKPHQQHLVMSMKKSPSPPGYLMSPRSSPMTPPTDEVAAAGSRASPLQTRFCTTAEIHQKFNRTTTPTTTGLPSFGPAATTPSILSSPLNPHHHHHQHHQIQHNHYSRENNKSIINTANSSTSPTTCQCSNSENILAVFNGADVVLNQRNGNAAPPQNLHNPCNGDFSGGRGDDETKGSTSVMATTDSSKRNPPKVLPLQNTNNQQQQQQKHQTDDHGGNASSGELQGGGENGLGVLNFRIRYKAEKCALVVAVVRCHDLPVKDTTLMTCDPYVKLQLLPEKQQRVKTRVLRHTRQPCFEEDFTFTNVQPEQLDGITLHFVVLSFDRYSRDDVIGEIFYPLSSLDVTAYNQGLEIATDIQPRNLKMKAQGRGEVLLSLCWQPTANRLTVVVLKARNLPKMDLNGLADPYVKMHLVHDGARLSKKKTHVKKRTLNPVFNESFVFDLPPTSKSGAQGLDKVSLQIQLLDWDRVTKNEVIGRLELGPEATSASATHHWAEVVGCPRRQIAEWHKLRD